MWHNKGSTAGGTHRSAVARGEYITLTESLAEQHPEAGIVCHRPRVRRHRPSDCAGLPNLDRHDLVVPPRPSAGPWWLSHAVEPHRCRTATPAERRVVAFGGASPDSMTLVIATTSKDVTNYQGVNGYGVHIQSASAAASGIYGQLSTAQVRPLKGCWITLAARPRVPAVKPGTRSVKSLHDNVQAEIRSRSMQSAPVDGFVWLVVFEEGIYGGSAANGTAIVTIDGMCLLHGVLPRRAMWGSVAEPVGPVPLGFRGYRLGHVAR